MFSDKENVEIKEPKKETSIMTTKSNKLKQLNLNPLAVAKYFWSKGIENFSINQDLIYLSYLEALKDGYLLFKEEWQAWPNGPVTKLVIDKMFDNRHNFKKLFAKVGDLDSELAINYTDKVFEKYHNTEPYILSQKSQNKPWKDARKPLKSERDIAKIPLESLIKFTNGNGKRVRV